ncbi:hypothetical protein N7510_008127 [Penicillium lagena]|uniref:uncharacterized protein n=1 Tax=Penicillium lagena TaxID=94218 RepID=UPI00253FCB85|nr:uncharacterized protein N7510_008127 [Penicillium lagena]KAJ5611408.1 hypothetical protein N7510_008127 [Penicillium lagena]
MRMNERTTIRRLLLAASHRSLYLQPDLPRLNLPLMPVRRSTVASRYPSSQPPQDASSVSHEGVSARSLPRDERQALLRPTQGDPIVFAPTESLPIGHLIVYISDQCPHCHDVCRNTKALGNHCR